MSDPATPTPVPAASPAPVVAAPTSLLGTPPPPAAAPPADVKPTEPAKAGEPAKTETPASPAPLELKLPEGLALDEAALGAFKGKAAELGLDSVKAQGLLEFYATTQQAAQKAALASWQATDTKWQEAVKADAEIGGANLARNVTLAQRAVTAIGGAELADVLDRSGLGNHPALVKAFVRLGKAMAEDSVAGTSGGSPGSSSDVARSLYPTMFKE